MGVYGPPLAITLNNCLMFLLMTIYTSKIQDEKIKQAWHMPSRSSFELIGLKEFLKIGIPSILMLCVEIWSFELMAILAAMISVEAIAVQSIIINNSHVFFMPHFGNQIAAIVLIGQNIGAR
jgi:MATE family multidrug resistance protein